MTGTTGPDPRKTRRYYAQIELSPNAVSSQTSTVVKEVLQHLAALYGANVTVTLEIEANVPNGIPDDIRRVIDENSRVLHFKQHGFEEE